MSSIFEELRVLDDRDEARTLRFATSALPMWPFVRWLAFSAAQDQALGLQPAFATGRTLRQTAALVARSQLHGPLSAKGPFDIVIVGSSGGVVLQREGRWFDRINDYFAMEFPERTLVLDKAGASGYKQPRFPPHVRCYDTFDIRAGAIAKLRRPADADVAAIDRLVTFIRDRFPVALSGAKLDGIRAQLMHWSVRLPVVHGMYMRFFELARPRVLFIEDGHYGGFTHVYSWARAAGIATAELQHGVISRSHLAYNYGSDDFATCLPQSLLLYGEAWRSEIRTPSEPVVVGCPHFSETARARTSSETVLTISQGICTDAMVKLTAAVARRYPDRKCVFRLHPGEVPFRERYASLGEIPNVEISDRGDIYQLLQKAGVVIGHSSTALVEAAGIGVPVCVLDDESSRAILPHDVGTWFRTVDELLPIVESPPATEADPDRFFAPHWRDRYRTFIERVTLTR